MINGMNQIKSIVRSLPLRSYDFFYCWYRNVFFTRQIGLDVFPSSARTENDITKEVKERIVQIHLRDHPSMFLEIPLSDRCRIFIGNYYFPLELSKNIFQF